MKLVLSAALALALTALPAHAALPVGAAAPNIVTKAAKGGKQFDFALKTALKKGPVVVYFFPAAFTGGCTIEAHAFAEAADDFAANGASLIGLSADPIDKLAKFSIEACRDKFPVGTASAGTIKGYDVQMAPGAKMTNRTSYVIAPGGKVIFALTQGNPVGHVEGTLAAVKAYRAGKR
ncbi:redoxin domain-containing protein [Sphingomonas qilianensis]|uniref:thioredoxin-dependent peroxiredoxin n=1 Tax=Sphingomonas qilianensis TaxID=1736690 RepID=A0ABU9XPR0_9SPHN